MPVRRLVVSSQSAPRHIPVHDFGRESPARQCPFAAANTQSQPFQRGRSCPLCPGLHLVARQKRHRRKQRFAPSPCLQSLPHIAHRQPLQPLHVLHGQILFAHRQCACCRPLSARSRTCRSCQLRHSCAMYGPRKTINPLALVCPPSIPAIY